MYLYSDIIVSRLSSKLADVIIDISRQKAEIFYVYQYMTNSDTASLLISALKPMEALYLGKKGQNMKFVTSIRGLKNT